MKLRKIILHGFKSFADRTEFDIGDGITVVVGPNGCGKSNVVDAVKWVLGEQRPGSLRGKEMQDVIFSGTDGRRAVGFAEASLVLDNSARTLAIDYEEVVLTRRLFRSGESEYLINGNSCRLRDIRELMMDSGGGPGGLTVMEQGNIDRLLQADPHERRLVFEEAAGIARYRARRRETERKLDRTGDNLARLRDILSEYETSQRSLKIQAGKARRYREFTEELKKKRLAGALARYADLARRRERAQEELDAVEQLERQARTSLEEAVEEGEGRRKELEALRELVLTGEGEMAVLVAEGRAAAEKRAAREREIEELAARASSAGQKSSEAANRAGSFAGDLGAARAECIRAEELGAARREAHHAAEALFDEVEARVRLLRAEREALDLRRAETLADETKHRNEEVSSEAEIRALNHRLARLEQKAKSSGEELQSLEAEREESELRLKGEEERLRALEDRYAAAEAGAREARHTAEDATQDERGHAGEAAGFAARRDVLCNLMATGEGLSAGTKALLESGLPGVAGTVADLIDRAGGQAAALDQVLGELAGAVVVDTTEQALAAVEWLKEGRRGRARIIPADRAGSAPLPAPFESIESERTPLLGALLSGTRVVETVEEALAAQGRVVILGGEEFGPSGAIIGGTGEPGAGLIRRRTELDDVDGKLASAEQARDEAAARAEVSREAAAGWERALDELRPALRSAREAARLAGQKMAEDGKAAAARTGGMELEAAERADIERVVGECAERHASAKARRLEVERLREDLEAESRALRERLERAAVDREEAGSRRTEAKVESARWAEKSSAAVARVRALEEAIATAEREERTRADEAESCRTRRQGCLDEIEVIALLGAEREKNLGLLGKEVERRRQAAGELAAELEAGGREVRALREAHERRREELERHRLADSELRLRIETLLEQVQRDHGLELDRTEADAGQADAEPEQLEREIAELRTKLERLGNVNHAALEQLAEVEERLAFMRREECDLLAAERQLRETISRIDEHCSERFRETFEQIQKSFHVVFRKLFGGGKAEVFLENPEDVLGSGVEIRVRPPGKELRNMALLSGGEKSLTTVALLFSIYHCKPPPFCLLDEVDAALDESNIVRMCEMLKEFATRGQFLVITHARPTMTVADTLYGVTMPEAGVSRRVAVRFQDIEAGRIVGLN